ncbi:ATP-binding cassette domain-containing protein [Paucisalibacillus sp. EB02]|uniref:ATP-binding cassette domain-containing protein n=1 Tax=Paucisalibacillus sp. EB02 TaxID=1347087 RepID=UPI0004B65A3B|nr:ATP-binding cassette domain-containing protein [Paucisalibacillus sp. EB02]
MQKPIVSIKNVSKTYSLFKKKSDQLLELFSFNRNKRMFSALSKISFEVYKGETIGIIGVNGSGKSTLSSILAQVTPPTSGEIDIQGETSLVAISAGLNNFLTGLENIELKCLMHGLNKREIEKITPEIIEFADIGDFINQPIKSYSSGMKSRLGFAISVHIQPDILVVDEALSVGDSTFYQKCLEKFDEFKEQGKTIFFISHSLSQVQSISDRILWLNFGQVHMFDDKDVVANEYSTFIKWFNDLDKKEKREYREKMLYTQIEKDFSSSRNRVSRKERKKNWAGINTTIQFSLILIYFIIATVLMFVDNPISAITGLNHSDNVVIEAEEPTLNVPEEEENTLETVGINQNGLIQVKSAAIYNDMEFSDKLAELPFATQIYIVEEINDSMFKIESTYGLGYVEKNKVQIIDDEGVVQVDVSVDEFIPLFPESLQQTYGFFFSFLNAEGDTIKDSLQGLTDEYEDGNGNIILEYSYENVTYTLNDEGQSYVVEIDNLDLEQLDEVNITGSLESQEEGLYYYLTDTYQIYLDITNESIRFETY